MPKLSDNQSAAVDALRTLLKSTGATCASASEWKKAAPKGVTVTAKSLVAAKAVRLIKAKNRDSATLAELYALPVNTEQTSDEVRKIAGRVLDDPNSSEDAKSLAGSALTQ